MDAMRSRPQRFARWLGELTRTEFDPLGPIYRDRAFWLGAVAPSIAVFATALISSWVIA